MSRNDLPCQVYPRKQPAKGLPGLVDPLLGQRGAGIGLPVLAESESHVASHVLLSRASGLIL